ncbi:MAG: hypothetical protein AMJ46_02475 [Latescibacteria bacterium DG_63]|nr:MAG: hypothetical protein AMJ46_02475 [Latescibacteria bacterium DG_63]
MFVVTYLIEEGFAFLTRLCREDFWTDLYQLSLTLESSLCYNYFKQDRSSGVDVWAFQEGYL